MATRGDAELYRAVSSVMSDVADLFQPSERELQAARIASQETMQFKDQEFRKEMEDIRFENEVLADDLDRKADQLVWIKQQELSLSDEMTKRDQNFKELVYKQDVSDQAQGVVQTVHQKIKNRLGGISDEYEARLANFHDNLERYQYDIALEDRARADFQLYHDIDSLGKEGVIDETEVDLIRQRIGDEFGTTEDFDRYIKHLRNPVNTKAYWGGGELQKEQALKLRGERSLEDSGINKHYRVATWYADNVDAILPDVALASDEKSKKRAKEFNTILGDARAMAETINRKDKANAPTYNAAVISKLGETLKLLINDYARMGWSDAKIEGWLLSDDPEAELKKGDVNFKGVDEGNFLVSGSDPQSERWSRIIAMQKMRRAMIQQTTEPKAKKTDPNKPVKKPGESAAEFAKRLADYKKKKK